MESARSIACASWLAIACLASLASGQPFTSTPPSQVIQIEGMNVTLKCTASETVLPGGEGKYRLILQQRRIGQQPTVIPNSPLFTYIFEHHTVNTVRTLTTYLMFTAEVSEEANYTCILFEGFPVFKVTHTASTSTEFRVAVAPKIDSNDTVTVIEGETANLTCTASGIPVPTLQWWQDGTLLKSAVNTTELTLTLPMVQRASAGYYECRAENMADDTQSERELIVYYKPEIHIITDNQLIPVNDGLLLRCEAMGLPAPEVKWLHHRHNLSTRPHLTLSQSLEAHAGGVQGSSNLTSVEVMAGDEGQYTCQASNVAGHRRHHVQVTLQFRPDAPEPINFSNSSFMRKMELLWRMPNYHNSSITDFEVEQQTQGSGDWTPSTVVKSADLLSAEVTNLTPAVEYRFRVRVRNAIGLSNFSTTVKYRRTLPILPVAPDDVAIVDVTPTSFKVAWAFDKANWTAVMGELTKIHVQYGLSTLDPPEFSEKLFPVASESQRQGVNQVTGLQKGSEYVVIVRSFNVQLGTDLVEMLVNTTTTVPGTASEFTATALSHEKVLLRWSGLDDGGLPLTELKLKYQENGQTTTRKLTSPFLTEDSVTLSNFKPEATYLFHLIARNSEGRSRPGSFSNNVTMPEHQFAPDIHSVSVISTSATRVTLRWNLTDYSPLVPIKGYNLDWGIDNRSGRAVQIDELDASYTYILGGLPANTEIVVRMRSYNEYGPSVKDSPALVFRTLTGHPRKPTQVLLRESGPESVKLAWTLAEEDEFPATQLLFRVRRKESLGATVNVFDRTVDIPHSQFRGDYVLSGLQPLTDYSILLIAVNEFGNSDRNIQFEFKTHRVPLPTGATSGGGATTSVMSSTETEEASSNSQMVIIIAAACGGGVVLLLLLVVVLIYLKRKQNHTDNWQVRGAVPVGSQKKSGTVPNWYSGQKNHPVSPIGENHEESYSVAVQRTESNLSFKGEKALAAQPEMFESDHDMHQPGVVDPTTFTSFTVARQPSGQQLALDGLQQSAPYSPPRTPPTTPPLTPALPPPKYTSSPIVTENLNMSDGQDLSQIEQTATFAPLRKTNTDV